MRQWWLPVLVLVVVVTLGVSVLTSWGATFVVFIVGLVSWIAAIVQAVRRRRWGLWLAVAIVGVSFWVVALGSNYVGLVMAAFLVSFVPVAAATAQARRPDAASESGTPRTGRRIDNEHDERRVWAAGTTLAVAAIVLPPLTGAVYLATCTKEGGFMGHYNACRDTIDIGPVVTIAVAISTVMLIVAIIQRLAAHGSQKPASTHTPDHPQLP